MRPVNPASLLLSLLLAGGCADTQLSAPSPPRSIRILTSFQPLFSFTSAVCRESKTISVSNLAPRELGPHDYDPTSAESYDAFSKAVRTADAIVTLRSLRLAHHFDRLYPLARSLNIRLVEIDPCVNRGAEAPGILLMPDPASARTGQSRSNRGLDAPNPHVWLSLSHAAILVENLTSDLISLDLAGAALYRANAQVYKKALLSLKTEYELKFAALETAEILSLSDAFPYLTTEMGIRVVEYVLDGNDPVAVFGRVKATGVRVVLAETSPADTVKTALRTLGARIVVLSTLERGWGTGPRLDPSGYLKSMRKNLELLHRALAEAD